MGRSIQASLGTREPPVFPRKLAGTEFPIRGRLAGNGLIHWEATVTVAPGLWSRHIVRVFSISGYAMYAIIEDGGRQYKVEEGQIVTVDYRPVAKGQTVEFANVLAVSADGSLKLGKPTLPGAVVAGEVVDVRLGEKLVVQKFRRRKNSRRRTGHRQLHTMVRVSKIKA